MIQYILRILGFVALWVIALVYFLWSFIFGDFRETWRMLERDIHDIRDDFLKVLRGEPFL